MLIVRRQHVRTSAKLALRFERQVVEVAVVEREGHQDFSDPDEGVIEGVPHPPADMSGPLGPLFSIIKDERVAFLVVGGFNTAVAVAWYWLFIQLFESVPAGYMIALGVTHVASVLTAFFLQRYFVFRVRGQFFTDLWRFEVVNLNALAFNAVALPVLVQGVGMKPFPAQLVVTAFIAVVTFFAHKYFSFRRSHEAPSDEPTPSASDRK